MIDEKKYIKRVGESIAELRKQKNITQVELAFAINFEKSNMSRIENGKTNPTLVTLIKIAKALDIKPKDLLDF